MPDEMNGTEIIKRIMTGNGITQTAMAILLGYKGQGTVSQRINTKRMSLDKFVKMVNVLGYEVIVGKKTENGVEPMCFVKAREEE